MSVLFVSFSPAIINNHVIPVCLPKENSVLGGREECYVTGWGDTKGETELTHLKAPFLELGIDLCPKYIHCVPKTLKKELVSVHIFQPR